MRKLFNLLMMFCVIGGMALMTSCDDDNEDITPTDPVEEGDVVLELDEADGSGSITVDVDNTTGSTQTVRVKFTSTTNMNRLYVTQNVSAQGEEPFKLEDIVENIDTKGDGSIDLDNSRQNLFEFEFDLPVPTVGSGNVVYSFWATSGRGDYRDKEKRLVVGPGDIVLNYGGSNPDAEVSTYSAKLLAAPLDDGSSETFISTFNGQIYQISAGIELASYWDFGYYWLSGTGASLASTATYPALFDHDDNAGTDLVAVADLTDTPQDELNNFYFATSTMTTAEFEAIGVSSDLDALTVSISANEEINQLEVDDVIEFIDSYGKKGLIRVKEVEPGFNQGDYIVIDIKVQP